MTYLHAAYLLYMAGSLCFFIGTAVLWMWGGK